MFKKFSVKSEVDEEVTNYELAKFDLKITPEAKSFEKSQLSDGANFIIDKSSANRSGLSYLKDKRIENEIKEKVEKLLLVERDKIFEEFKEKGFEQGLLEGRSQGKKEKIEEFQEVIESSLVALNNSTKEIKNFYKSLVDNAETDILSLIKMATSKICLKEISMNDEVIRKLIHSSLEQNAKEETLKIELAKIDFENLHIFLKELQEKSLPQEVTFIESEDIQPGGLVVHSGKGTTNKSIETRFNNIWSALSPDE